MIVYLELLPYCLPLIYKFILFFKHYINEKASTDMTIELIIIFKLSFIIIPPLIYTTFYKPY